MLSSVSAFAEYWQRVHTRTREMVAAIPDDRLDWRPAQGEFTCAELARHIASARRMNIVSATLGEGLYPGHDERFGISRRDLLHYLDASHAEVSNRLAGLRDEDLDRVVHYKTTTGKPSSDTLGPLLLHVVNHGTQHRSEVAAMLTELGHSPGDLDLLLYLRQRPTSG